MMSLAALIESHLSLSHGWSWQRRKDQAHGHRHALDPTRKICTALDSASGPKRTPTSWVGVHGILHPTHLRKGRMGERSGGPVPGTRRVPWAAATLQSLELRGMDEGLKI